MPDKSKDETNESKESNTDKMYWRPKEAKYILNKEKMEVDIILTIEFKENADIEKFSEKSKAYELSDELFYRLTNLLVTSLEKMREKEPPTDMYS